MVSEVILEAWVDFNWQMREKERHTEINRGPFCRVSYVTPLQMFLRVHAFDFIILILRNTLPSCFTVEHWPAVRTSRSPAMQSRGATVRRRETMSSGHGRHTPSAFLPPGDRGCGTKQNDSTPNRPV